MLLYIGAGAVLVGLACALILTFAARSGSASVAHSLALIDQGVRPHEMAKQDLPLGDRVAKPIFASTRRLAIAISPKGTTSRIVRLLDFAGNPAGLSAERVLGFKGAGLIIGAVVGLLLGRLSLAGVLASIVLGAIGFFLPDLLLHNSGQHRQDALRRGLADALDMLTVCVEAGQGFDAALQQVAGAVTGPVAGEFARVIQEVSIGKSRAAAFSSLASRTSVPEIKTFVTAIVQADQLGIPIGQVLHEQAGEMRLIRRQRAEEQAQKVPIKLLFPMMFCIFPALFIAILGPGAIRIVQMFSHLGS
ncbi:type II secretion system F family protein [Leekyejoonella antrihumi]|uniref:Type II secretion system F family protein n=1 Tax=Leekyejoonella antrihumi TaxID=1660198 RepID=A0A563DVH2_9MICO|nr:type II secretion system F family protein [Leekyejoonella antrihumi]TWP33714.1 type II secretion system F family protein [Leekyejoonella antrihumi]